jgi:hypothetical protein
MNNGPTKMIHLAKVFSQDNNQESPYKYWLTFELLGKNG